jgi:hypothetical protein
VQNDEVLQTCAPQRYKRKLPRKSPKYQVWRTSHHSKMAVRRQSTIPWKTIRKKSRFKLALCLTVIINTKTSSSINMFPEGVSFDTDSFPITTGSGSIYRLSDRRLDFEGVLTRVNVQIHGAMDSMWKDTVQWKVLGKRQAFNIPKTVASLPSQHTWSGTQAIIRDEEVKLLQGNGCFSKTMKISQENNKPIMPSAPGITQFKANVTNTRLKSDGTPNVWMTSCIYVTEGNCV